jgi:Concanavalin A-like lectin/glucanases superfamily
MIAISRRKMLKLAALAGATGFVGGGLVRTAEASDSYSSVVLAKGPVGYWRLGETTGFTASDSSGDGYDGVYLGNPTLGQVGAINGDPDASVGFNGPSSMDYVEIPDPADGSSAFSQPASGLGLTVEVWMRPDILKFPGQTSDIYIHWLGKCVSGSGQCEWGFRFYSQDSPNRPNRISAYIWNPGGGEGAGAYFQDPLVAGAWIHVVAVYEPGDMNTVPPAGVHIFKNGVHRLGPPSSGTLYRTYGIVPVAGTLPLRLGTRDAATSGSGIVSYFTGGLDEVAIYPRVLRPEEILENYNTGIAAGSFNTLASARRTRSGRDTVHDLDVRNAP